MREDYDLLTAALLGAAVGAVMMLAFRPRPRRPAQVAIERGVKVLDQVRRRGGHWLRDRQRQVERGTRDLAGQLPVDDVSDAVGEYLASAREAIDDTVSRELKDLRRAIRRQRKRLGV